LQKRRHNFKKYRPRGTLVYLVFIYLQPPMGDSEQTAYNCNNDDNFKIRGTLVDISISVPGLGRPGRPGLPPARYTAARWPGCAPMTVEILLNIYTGRENPGLLFRDGAPYCHDRNFVCLWRRHNCN
jgi:hypothetical protein